MKKALLIGWRSGAAQAVQAVGYAPTCIITPADKAAALRAGFDDGLVTASDPADVEQVLAALKRHSIDMADFAAVGTNLERCMVTASTVGALVGARSIPVHTAVLLRDKIAQKAAVGAAGLPVAACRVIDTLDELPTDPDGYPVVVKPLAGEGTRETHYLQGAQDACRLVEARPGNAGHGPWAVEEFIEGAELQVDGVVRDGQLCALAVSRYLQNLIAIKTGGPVGGVLLNPEDHLRLYKQATDLTTAALTALGHTDGVFHLEAFDQGHRLVFSECAGRVSGGLVREMLVRKLGLDLTAEWARALVGTKPEIPVEPQDDLSYGFANLAASPGEIILMPTTADVLRRDLVVEGAVELGPGHTAPDQTTASNLRAGRFIASAESEKAVEAAVHDTLAWFTSHTAVK
ncbi:acetyl-CoA carboxylase biotin carboxylase subunit family protein [Streptomyces chartreusis]|uniref:ATP-grasp domain-containing protein n=1 Tax=Streptomyces chartreusis TaxID=1969 RepID=UPI00371056AC